MSTATLQFVRSHWQIYANFYLLNKLAKCVSSAVTSGRIGCGRMGLYGRLFGANERQRQRRGQRQLRRQSLNVDCQFVVVTTRVQVNRRGSMGAKELEVTAIGRQSDGYRVRQRSDNAKEIVMKSIRQISRQAPCGCLASEFGVY